MKIKWGLYALLSLALAGTAACKQESDGGAGMPGESPQRSQSTGGTTGSGSNAELPESTPTEASGNDGNDSGDSSARANVKLTPVFQGVNLDRPTAIESRGDRLYVTEQEGRIVALRAAEADKGGKTETLLDLTDRVYSKGTEQGLLGLAFDPQYEVNGFIYVNYTTRTNTIIARYSLPLEERAASGDGKDEKVLMTFKQLYANHNGGQLAFGPDGYLYIGTGDGGGSGDPQGNGQNKQTLLGKILRIDIGKAEGDKAYAIPADNPFAKSGGAKEIYAYGLRNPWRFSFDADTGDLWAADVGQNKFEEIDKIVNGGNYGWKLKEADRCYEPSSGCESAAKQAGVIAPIWSYGREDGQSVTGGYVYRGTAIPGLAGRYVYGDYGSGAIWALKEEVSGHYGNELLLQSELNITTFGLDEQGELYLTSADGELYRLDPR
ncbi:PQQ-dependent sugar dehydrogenase [Cohnella hashimotonis]|uniref:PQQ-dependent sugar dehydrogenase n=1 Tax=Cohnella hashimotonis TaxID=2826895 RepID=A0ABT6TGC6_9BACL|nr:PQQ-dependent sugar dehydrogenase [Cohnella hashimotonis]